MFQNLTTPVQLARLSVHVWPLVADVSALSTVLRSAVCSVSLLCNCNPLLSLPLLKTDTKSHTTHTLTQNNI